MMMMMMNELEPLLFECLFFSYIFYINITNIYLQVIYEMTSMDNKYMKKVEDSISKWWMMTRTDTMQGLKMYRAPDK